MDYAEIFNKLLSVNVNEHTETKKTGSTELTYLSWPYAIAEVKKVIPDFKYKVWKDEHGIPYVYDPNTGYMVYTSVEVNDVEYEMFLPVMDGANHSMKAEPYTIHTKYKDIEVASATMFDINKTIMRCLVKNLAVATGLGLYIYAGEDIPIPDVEENSRNAAAQEALANAKKELKETGNAILASGGTKDILWNTIAKYNSGSKNVADIKTKEVCDQIIEELKVTLNGLNKNKSKEKK